MQSNALPWGRGARHDGHLRPDPIARMVSARRRLLRTALVTACLVLPMGLAAAPPAAVDWGEMSIEVTAAQNRAVSFTNKRAGVFYTQTHRNDHPEHAWYRGYNIAGQRVFSEMLLSIGGEARDPAAALAYVTPEALEYRWPDGVKATVRLFDGVDVIALDVAGVPASDRDSVVLTLAGEPVRADGQTGAIQHYRSQDGDKAPVHHVAVLRNAHGFLIAIGNTRDAAVKLVRDADAKHESWTKTRHRRLTGLFGADHSIETSDPTLDKALRWLTHTTDQLVTAQRGQGIYAGLPWFNQYWGRDTFISFTGALLVTGQFDTAKEILRSFAKFQDRDPESPFFGRMPNIVLPGALDYHTTDGTPRFVIALRDYVRYTGDVALARELFPHVRDSIEGSLVRFTGEDMLLRHADNETWMDARREPDKAAYAPRAASANDIQALWIEQLQAGAELAQWLGDAHAETWRGHATTATGRFRDLFLDRSGERIADRVDANGVPDWTLRPNLLFALHLVEDDRLRARILRRTWETLVFPWGVATIDPADRRFHRYHLSPDYHKDAAYHNGTVWHWLNGIAMQRVLEFNQPELAWPLFDAMNRDALERGVVGGLAETMDAYPKPGESLPRLTGTYLQGWSNAEQLRTWYQGFLGVQPDLGNRTVTVAPRIPRALGSVNARMRLGNGTLHYVFRREGVVEHHTWTLQGTNARLRVDLPGFATQLFPPDARNVSVTVRNDRGVAEATGMPALRPDGGRTGREALWSRLLADTPFAKPDPSRGLNPSAP